MLLSSTFVVFINFSFLLMPIHSLLNIGNFCLIIVKQCGKIKKVNITVTYKFYFTDYLLRQCGTMIINKMTLGTMSLRRTYHHSSAMLFSHDNPICQMSV